MFKLIKKARNAPKEFQDLLDEIGQLRIVIQCVFDADIPKTTSSGMSTITFEAKEKLLEIERVVAYRLVKVNSGEEEQVDRIHWARRSEEPKKLLEDLRKIVDRLTTLLAVANM